MSKFTDFLANTKSDAIAFNTAHGKLAACIVSFIVGAVIGKLV